MALTISGHIDDVLATIRKTQLVVSKVLAGPPPIPLTDVAVVSLLTASSSLTEQEKLLNYFKSQVVFGMTDPATAGQALGVITKVYDLIKQVQDAANMLDKRWYSEHGRPLVVPQALAEIAEKEEQEQESCGWTNPGACVKLGLKWIAIGAAVYFGGKWILNRVTR